MLVPYRIVYSSSDCVVKQKAAWISARECRYPQELGLELNHEALLEKISICLSETMTSSGIIVLVHETDERTESSSKLDDLSQYFAASFEPLGTFQKLRMTLNVKTRARFIKILLKKPLPDNLYHQVAIQSLGFYGTSIVSNKAVVPRSSLSITLDSEEALLQAGVPLEIVADLSKSKMYDSVSLKAMPHMSQQDIQTLQPLGKEILQLEQDERIARALENPTLASKAAQRLTKLRRERDELIAAALACSSETSREENAASFLSSFVLGQAEPETLEPDRSFTGSQVVRDRLTDGNLDSILKQWVMDDRSESPEPLSDVEKHDYYLLLYCLGAFCTRCLVSKQWRLRRAAIETIEMYSCLLSQQYDMEEIHECFNLVLQLSLEDPVSHVYLSALHFLCTVFETGDSYHTCGISFVTTKTIRQCFNRIIQFLMHQVIHADINVRTATEKAIQFVIQQEYMYKYLVSALVNLEPSSWKTAMGRLILIPLIVDSTLLQDHVDLLKALSCLLARYVIHQETRLATVAQDCMVQLYDCIGRESVENYWPIQLIGQAKEVMEKKLSYQRIGVRVYEARPQQHEALFRKFPLSRREEDRMISKIDAQNTLPQVPVGPLTFDTDAIQSKAVKMTHGKVRFVGTLSSR